ncbi:MAG TPA: hypothetical protein PKD78_11345, partial [Saprospiraceae bacterium]|nr:hypothetical protein [Saprospiraceae bacterium]
MNAPNMLGCLHQKITLTAVPNMSEHIIYTWGSSSEGNIIGPNNTSSISADQPGIYTVTVTNTQTGCTATAEHQIQAPIPPPLAVANAQIVKCSGTQLPLSGAGSTAGPNIFYLWTTSNGTLLGDVKQRDATAGGTGTYILQVLDVATGCRAYDTVQVTQSQEFPTLSIVAPGVLECKPDTLVLSASASPPQAALQWIALQGGHIVSGGGTATPQVDAAGVYLLTVTHPASGCTATATVQVQTTVPLHAAVAPPDTLSCLLPALVLDAVGSSVAPGVGYLWTTPDGLIVSGAATLTPTVAAAGEYLFSLLDTLSGCSRTLSVRVREDRAAPLAAVAPPPALTCALHAVPLDAARLDSLPHVQVGWTSADGLILGSADSLHAVAGAAGLYL